MTSAKIEGPLEFRIRRAASTDKSAIDAVVLAAFGQPQEADLVGDLRNCGVLLLETVAEAANGKIIGHLAISRVTGAGPGHRLAISCLAPVSVLPELQRMGVGGAMIRAAVADLAQVKEDLVLVLGDPAYYQRFGFDPALARLVAGPYAGDAFMALALTETARQDLPVEVTFATPFEAFE